MKSVLSINVPGTKSLANRALILAALAQGKTILRNVPTDADDVKILIKALRDLGVKIKQQGKKLTVIGTNKKGINVWKAKKKSFSTENAGTATRFLAALLAIIPQTSTLHVNEQMEQRPIKPLVDALRKLGAKIEYLKKEGFPPLKITGQKLKGAEVEMDASISSQFLSAILMIAVAAENDTAILLEKKVASKPYIALTTDLMKKFGARITEKKNRITVAAKKLRGIKYEVEADMVAASYFGAISAIHDVALKLNLPEKTLQGEKIFFEKLRLLKNLKNKTLRIDCNSFPDSTMTLAIVAAVTPGKTILKNIGHLRAKETDRITALETELGRIGVRVHATKTSLTIHGNPHLKIPKPVLIHTYNDHRMAMCFAVLKTKFPKLSIENPACVKKSYPDFWKDYKKAVLHIGKNIVLTGMRGSGKTTIGKRLAKKLKYDFLDLDEIFEKTHKTSIANFIQKNGKNGWKKFRAAEKKLVKMLSEKTHTVIATGGGTIIDSENKKMLKKNGIVILLECRIAILQKRIKNDPLSKQRRPPLKNLKTLYAERKKRYHASADLILQSNYENENTILEKFFPSF